jgi:hypothetical protein
VCARSVGVVDAMAARKVASKAGGAEGMSAHDKCLTMMRPGELFSMDEDMVLDLALSPLLSFSLPPH